MPRYEDYKFTQKRNQCVVTGIPFKEGETVYTALFPTSSPKGYLRQDYSEKGWSQQHAQTPFSYWKHIWSISEQAPIEKAPSLIKDNKSLFIKLTDEDDPTTEHLRFVLAIALERSRKLKQIGTQQFPQGLVRLYKFTREHRIYVVPDPNLSHTQIAEFQEKVSLRLEGFKKDSLS